MSERGEGDRNVVLVQLLPDHPRFGRGDAAAGAGLAPAREGDAGIDLVACEQVELAPGERAAVSAGIRIALPPGVEAQVRPRSGQALRRGLTMVNTPGTIDPGYRGPVRVILLNAAPALLASELEAAGPDVVARIARGLRERTIRIERGERIAQLVFARFERPSVRLVERVPEDTERGAGGFGSTGHR
jgi:dUTP pyrophosphatase